MDSQRIRLSALGRDVKVGNLYNYHSDAISICNVRVPQESISITKKLTSETDTWFHLPQQSIRSKYEALGINAHLCISILSKKSANLGQLWFGDFDSELRKLTEDENVRVTQNPFVARVTFFFRVCRRIEVLCPKFIDWKLNEYQMQSGGVATHLVEQVIYGAEFICTMERTIDRQHETKENAQRNLYLAAKEYFNQVFGGNSTDPDLPAALDKVQCQILSSLNPGKEVDGSFQQSIQHLIDAMSFDNDDGHWKPVEITLRNIPEQMESRLRLERDCDAKIIRKMHERKLERILDGNGALKVAHLKIFPQFQDVIYQFCYLLEPLRQKIKRFHETTPERNLEERQISNLFSDMMDWQIHRRSEMDKIFWLIEGTQLKMLDMAEIEMLTATNKPNRAKVFVLRAEFYPVPLIESIYAYIGNPSAISAPLPVLPVLSADKERLQKIREELQKFSAEAQSNSLLDQEELRHRYYIGITSEYPHLTDGTITTFGDFKKENDSPRKQQRGTGIMQKSRSFSGSEMNSSSGLCHQPMEQRDVSIKLKHIVSIATPSESRADMILSTEQRNNSILTESSADTKVVHYQSSKSPKMKQANQLKRLDEEGRRVEEEDTKSESLVDCMQTHCSVGDKLDENENCITEESVDDVGNQSVQYWNSTMSISHREFYHHEISIDMDCATETPPPDEIENDDQLNNQRIAEFFADEKNRCAELIKKRQPNVYLLNATDTSASEDLRWFDVGRPVRSPPTCMKNHKLIILMGATGCGKSTLINGMVNYILGVKWNDPFRFKCVREDETTARNQAISQTSSVTAYTIRHRNEMAVPYSITIIDTPGYGDTRGVKRDKEITRNIQQFLTQQESRVEEIHAACFVAASGDCRLTTTQPQRYIIDSALSIFGKDIKENIRLLVTFADNADPLVVDACRAADFPVTSASAGIIFSKFNSSVLYAFHIDATDSSSSLASTTSDLPDISNVTANADSDSVNSIASTNNITAEVEPVEFLA